jgi:hypothetical protein
MGIRESIARILGRSPRQGSNGVAANKTATELIAASEKPLSPPGGLSPFVANAWANGIIKNYAAALGLSDMVLGVPPEKVCPLTKALIIEKLRDLSIEKAYSIRQIIDAVMADGVKDDYELLDKLEKFDKPDSLTTHLQMDSVYDPTLFGHRVRFKSPALGKEAHFLVDDITQAQAVGCARSVDKSDSSSG